MNGIYLILRRINRTVRHTLECACIFLGPLSTLHLLVLRQNDTFSIYTVHHFGNWYGGDEYWELTVAVVWQITTIMLSPRQFGCHDFEDFHNAMVVKKERGNTSSVSFKKLLLIPPLNLDIIRTKRNRR